MLKTTPLALLFGNTGERCDDQGRGFNMMPFFVTSVRLVKMTRLTLLSCGKLLSATFLQFFGGHTTEKNSYGWNYEVPITVYHHEMINNAVGGGSLEVE